MGTLIVNADTAAQWLRGVDARRGSSVDWLHIACRDDLPSRRGGTVDASDLKSLVRKDVRVRIPPPAPHVQWYCLRTTQPLGEIPRAA